MVISTPLLLVLLVILLLAAGGSGYGYYSGGAYASPLGILVALIILGMIVWFFAYGPFWGPAPPPP